MWSQVQVPAGADLRSADHVQWGRPDSKEIIKQAYHTPLGALQPWTRPGIIDSKMQAMTTQSNANCKCSGYNILKENMVYTKMKKKTQATKKNRLYIYSAAGLYFAYGTDLNIRAEWFLRKKIGHSNLMFICYEAGLCLTTVYRTILYNLLFVYSAAGLYFIIQYSTRDGEGLWGMERDG